MLLNELAEFFFHVQSWAEEVPCSSFVARVTVGTSNKTSLLLHTGGHSGVQRDIMILVTVSAIRNESTSGNKNILFH